MLSVPHEEWKPSILDGDAGHLLPAGFGAGIGTTRGGEGRAANYGGANDFNVSRWC